MSTAASDLARSITVQVESMAADWPANIWAVASAVCSRRLTPTRGAGFDHPRVSCATHGCPVAQAAIIDLATAAMLPAAMRAAVVLMAAS